jgi:uncharacterized protein (TIGR02391 family)
MTSPRAKALDRLVSELESYVIDPNQYYDDAEPQSITDAHLTGKLDALARFCRRLNWSDLSSEIEDQIPLRINAPEALTRAQDYVLPEIRHRMTKTDIDNEASPLDWYWQLLHPRITAIARPRFEQGFFGDAILACYKEVNDAVKSIFFIAEHRELDGAGLMTTAFSPSNPIIRLSGLQSQSDKDEQQGYMQIFAGAITGIRNPKAHANVNPDQRKTLHLISLASLLMYRLDERI